MKARDEMSLPADLGQLFVQHGDRVYGFLLARTGSRAVAEDLTSVTFECAARAHAAGRGGELSEAWLVTVARRRLVDHWRTAARERRRFERLRNERLVDRLLHEPVTDMDDDVEAAFASLSERQRAALALRYLDDYSVNDVAEALQCTYGSAESLLSRARRGFAAALSKGRARG